MRRSTQRRTARRVLPLLALVLGCGGPAADRADDGEPASARGPTLYVAAASDLQAALPALIEAFEEQNGPSGPRVVATFGASGQLAEQIRQGGTFDLFLAANEAFVRDLADSGDVDPDSVRLYARGSLVLAIYKDVAVEIDALDDLKSPEIRSIAMANPAFAPYGAAARQALEHADLWEALGPKLVTAESVRQALQFVQSGNAEVGFVGKGIADVPEVRTVAVDPAAYEPLAQALGIVRRSPHPAEAEAFARFVGSDEGQDILGSFGFLPPTTP